jgi:MFS family permease
MDDDGRNWRLVVSMSSIHFIQHIFRILPAILPIIALDFPYPLWKLGALVSIYFLGSGFGQTPVGILADRYDRRLILPPSIGVMGLGYVVFAIAPQLVSPEAAAFTLLGATFTLQFALMGLGVLVSGVGASAIHPVGYPLVATNVSPDRVGSAYGVWGSAAKLGDAAAPMSIAVLILVVQWNDIFLLFGVVGIIYALGLFYAMSQAWFESRPADQRAAATEAEDGEPTAAISDEPASDRRHYVYPMVALLVFFVARGFSEKGLKTFLPTFLVVVYGYSFAVGPITLTPESFANVYFTAVFLIAAVCQLLTGHLVDRHDHRTVLIVFFVTAAVALVALASGSLTPLHLLGVLLVLGASNWGWTPARDALMNDVTPPAREGRTFGYLHTISHLVSAIAPVIIGYVAEESSLQQSFLSLAAVMLIAVAAIGSLFSSRVYRPIDHESLTTSTD